MGNWTLQYDGVRQEFGEYRSELTFSEAPQVDIADVINGDIQVADQDGLLMGVDVQAGTTVTFALHAVGDTRDEALSLTERLRAVWRADSVRRTAGAFAQLVSDRGRSTFGRPRRFSADKAIEYDGVIHVLADFQAVTDLWFGDVESVEVGLVPLPSGGLVAPLAAPLSTTESSDRSQAVTVGGELPTWPSVTIFGPITNPVVEIGPVRWEFRTTLAYDQSLTVDAAPWARTILRDGAGIPGTLTPASTRLANATVPPGIHEFVLRGASSLGTARAVASWRSAFYTP